MRMLSASSVPRRRIRWRALSLFLLSAVALISACNNAPADRREWRPADHDHTENPSPDQVQVTDAGSSEPGHGLDDVTIVAWQQNCTNCHGALGRGDGPEGPMLHAADLSRPDWQARVTDEQIANTIRHGRGKMPAFNLPDATMQHLVALIRVLDASRLRQATTAASSSAPNAAPVAKPTTSASPSKPAAIASARPKSP